MDLDTDHQPHTKLSSTLSSTRRLEFSSDSDADEAGVLGNLDISFDASPSENGKIRVRIHNPASSVSSRATSPGAISSSSFLDSDPIRHDGTYAAPSPSSMSSSSSSSVSTSAFSPMATSDPFFGIGGSASDFGGLFDSANFGGMLYGGAGSPSNDDFSYSLPSAVVTGSGCGVSSGVAHAATAAGFADLGNGEYSIPDPQAQGQKRRVRIALKSLPQPGGTDGGEWEVQIC